MSEAQKPLPPTLTALRGEERRALVRALARALLDQAAAEAQQEERRRLR